MFGGPYSVAKNVIELILFSKYVSLIVLNRILILNQRLT